MGYKLCGFKRGGGVLAVIIPMAFIWLVGKIWKDADSQ